ncbi:hypothetical protein BTVI_34381 [Pitangus sulphuratus]|nr:hypothetical protein BTVI_34381 [Pitangus sulphuratus]
MVTRLHSCSAVDQWLLTNIPKSFSSGQLSSHSFSSLTQVQDMALCLVESHTTGLGPLIQLVQILLQILLNLQYINTSGPLCIFCKIEGVLDTLVQIINEDIKENWHQYRAPWNTTCDWLPSGFSSINHNSLGLTIQTGFNPAKSALVQAVGCQLLLKNAVEKYVISDVNISGHEIFSKGARQSLLYLTIKDCGQTIPAGIVRLDQWDEDNWMKFNKAKFQMKFHFYHNNPMQCFKSGEECWESCLAEKDLGVLVSIWMNLRQQCVQMAKKASGILASEGVWPARLGK